MHAIYEINYFAVLVALLASFALGGVWYGVVIAKPYVTVLGRDALPPQKLSPLFIIGPVACNLFVVLTSAILIYLLQIDSLLGALGFGALVGVGYLLSTCMNIAINPNFPRPFMYTLINAPYFILSSLMTSAILVAMS